MAIDSSVLSESWQLDQLTRLYQHRPELVSAALQRLLTDDPELRWGVVVGAYLDQQINLGKAAELLGVDELSLRERFLDLGVPLRTGPAELADAQAEVAVFRRWFGRDSLQR
jgi:predicted HTH domain antitoxin